VDVCFRLLTIYVGSCVDCYGFLEFLELNVGIVLRYCLYSSNSLSSSEDSAIS
jgi:hypothetical protein